MLVYTANGDESDFRQVAGEANARTWQAIKFVEKQDCAVNKKETDNEEYVGRLQGENG